MWLPSVRAFSTVAIIRCILHLDSTPFVAISSHGSTVLVAAICLVISYGKDNSHFSSTWGSGYHLKQKETRQ